MQKIGIKIGMKIVMEIGMEIGIKKNKPSYRKKTTTINNIAKILGFG